MGQAAFVAVFVTYGVPLAPALIMQSECRSADLNFQRSRPAPTCHDHHQSRRSVE